MFPHLRCLVIDVSFRVLALISSTDFFESLEACEFSEGYLLPTQCL